jgi:hypothetical protein
MTLSDAVNKLYEMVIPRQDETKPNETDVNVPPVNNTDANTDNKDNQTNMAGDPNAPAGGNIEQRVAALEDAVGKILEIVQSLQGAGTAAATSMKAELQKFSSEIDKLKAQPDGDLVDNNKKPTPTNDGPVHLGLKRLNAN